MASSKTLDQSLTSLSQEISSKVAELTNLLNSGSHPIPSLKADSPSDYPSNAEINTARYAIIDAATTLMNLAMGPREFIFSQALCPKADMAVLGCLQHFDIFNTVPWEGSIPYSDIATKIGLSKDKTERIIKHAMTSRIFYEPEPGMVAHTANSIMPAKMPHLNAWIGTGRQNSDPAMGKLEEAFQKFGESGEINETAFNLALGKSPEDTWWSVLGNDGENERKGWRMKLFGMAMGGTRNPVLSREAPDNAIFDWEGLGDATVVDVGGGGGQVSVSIATFFPKLKFIIQDLPSQAAIFEVRVPPELRSRISFQSHDFFTTQPVKGAAVYILSSVLHDWSDVKAVEILRQLVPAMKPSSRICVLDGVMAEFGEVSNEQMRRTRSADLLMLSLFNARERRKEDWRALMEKVDPRLVVRQIVTVGGPRGLIEVGLRVE